LYPNAHDNALRAEWRHIGSFERSGDDLRWRFASCRRRLAGPRSHFPCRWRPTRRVASRVCSRCVTAASKRASTSRARAGAPCGPRRLQRRRRGCCRSGGTILAAFQARARSVLTRGRWSALALASPPASARSQPTSVARRRDEEEGGMDLMIARELQRVEERRVKQCVTVDRCPLSPVKKQ